MARYMKLLYTHGLWVVLFLLIICRCSYGLATSIVYDMKIRRLFNIESMLERHKGRLWIPTVIPIVFESKRRFIDEQTDLDLKQRRLITGSEFNIRYLPSKYWWYELTAGLQKEKLKARGTFTINESRIGFDDIVYSAGRQFYPANRTQLVFYIIGGFPTRLKVEPFEEMGALVGTRFFSFGGGSEASYQFYQKENDYAAIVFQNRFIHFFKRDWKTLTGVDATLKPANQTDLLFAFRSSIKNNFVDIGYNATFSTNEVQRTVNRVMEPPAIVRNAFFATIARIIPIWPMGNSFLTGAGFSIARAKTFKTRTIAGWLTLSANF